VRFLLSVLVAEAASGQMQGVLHDGPQAWTLSVMQAMQPDGRAESDENQDEEDL